jgi:hypothetical protein
MFASAWIWESQIPAGLVRCWREGDPWPDFAGCLKMALEHEPVSLEKTAGL